MQKVLSVMIGGALTLFPSSIAAQEVRNDSSHQGWQAGYMPHAVIARRFGLRKDVYQKQADINHDGVTTLDEVIDVDDDHVITDQEIEKWFLKNIQRLSEGDELFFGEEFVDLLPPRSRNKSHDLFISQVAEMLAPEKAKEKLDNARKEIDELFRTAHWGYGSKTGEEHYEEIADFGEFAIDACLEKAYGSLSSRKTAMATLKRLAWYDYDVSKASNAIITKAISDEDYYVRELAETAMRKVNKEKVLKTAQSNLFFSTEQSRLVEFLSKHYYNDDSKEIKDYADAISLDKKIDSVVRTQAIIWPGHLEEGGNYEGRCQRISSRLEDSAEKKDFRKYLATEGLQRFLRDHALRVGFHEINSGVVERLYDSYAGFINELSPGEQEAIKKTTDESLRLFVAENLVYEAFQHHEAQQFDEAKRDFKRANEMYGLKITETEIFYLDEKEHKFKTFNYTNFMKEHSEYR